MKTNILAIILVALITFGSKAQTVFLEDFNESSIFPEGWELKAIPEDENVVDYSLVGSSWCLDEGREFRLFFNHFLNGERRRAVGWN